MVARMTSTLPMASQALTKGTSSLHLLSNLPGFHQRSPDGAETTPFAWNVPFAAGLPREESASVVIYLIFPNKSPPVIRQYEHLEF